MLFIQRKAHSKGTRNVSLKSYIYEVVEQVSSKKFRLSLLISSYKPTTLQI